MESLVNLIRGMEALLNNHLENPSEDYENYEKFKFNLVQLRISLINNRDNWNFISDNAILPIAKIFVKFNDSAYIQQALGEYLIIMKTYGRILHKKAMKILINSMREIDTERKYKYDTDLVEAAGLNTIQLHFIKLSEEVEYQSYCQTIPYHSVPTVHYIKILWLVHEFYNKVIEKGEFTEYNITSSIIFNSLYDTQPDVYLKEFEKFFFYFNKKFFRLMVDKISDSDENMEKDISMIMQRLNMFINIPNNSIWAIFFQNYTYFSMFCTDIIYNIFTNTNYEYMTMVKKFFILQNWQIIPDEREFLTIDLDQVVFGDFCEKFRNRFNHVNYDRSTSIFVKLMESYYETFQDKCVNSTKTYNNNLKTYRMSSLIFNETNLWRKNANETLLYSINQIKGDALFETADNSITAKISKAFDHYIAYVRFLFFIASKYKEKYFLFSQDCKEKETLRFLNFLSLFELSVTVAELHAVNAYIAAFVIKTFIDLSLFKQYKHLVLEKFLIFLIMIKKNFGIYKVFLPFYEYIMSEIKSVGSYVFAQEYEFICLFRVNLICDEEDLNDDSKFLSQKSPNNNKYKKNKNDPYEQFYSEKFDQTEISGKFERLLEFGNSKLSLNSTDGVCNNILTLMKKMKHLVKYEKFIYINLFYEFLKNKQIFSKLIKNDLFRRNFVKLVSKFVHEKAYVVNVSRDNFCDVLAREFVPKLFEIINKFNFQIKEYYKIPKLKNFKDTKAFFTHLNEKLQSYLKYKTVLPIQNYIINHILESYEIIKRNETINILNSKNKFSNQENKLNLENYLKKRAYFPELNDNSKLLNEKKIFLAIKREGLIRFSNMEDDEYNQTLENAGHLNIFNMMSQLNHNIKHGDKDDEIVIDSIIAINSCFGDSIGIFLIKENIVNGKCNESAIKLIQNYLNFLISSNERSLVLRVVSVFKLMNNYFNKTQDEIKKEIIKEKCTIKSLGKFLRGYNNPSSYEDFFKSISKDLMNKILIFNQSYLIWKRICKNIKREKLVENLYKLGCNKICLFMIEDFVNFDMIETNKKNIKECQDYFMLNKYYDCYSRIDENEYIMKNYILSEDLNEKIKKSQKDYLSDYSLKLKNLSDEFFVCLDFEMLKEKFDYFMKTQTDMPIPTNIYFERNILGSLLNTYTIMGLDEIGKFNKKSEITKKILCSCFSKLYSETETSYGQFYQNKIYYEMWLITLSIIKETRNKIELLADVEEENNLYDPQYYQETRKVIYDLFTSRVLGISTNNLLQLKLRRVYCALFNLKELEQKILKDIIKIFRNNNEDENLKVYLIKFAKNFEKDYSRTNELYTILKNYLHLGDYYQFDFYYENFKKLFAYNSSQSNLMIMNVSDDARTKKESYKYYVLYFKSLQKYFLKSEIIEKIKKHLSDRNLWERSFEQVYGNGSFDNLNNSANNKVNMKMKKNYNYYVEENLSIQEINEFCNLCMLLIDFTLKELDLSIDSNFSFSNNNLDFFKIFEVTKYMIAVSTLSNEKKILFKLLPMTMNILFKLEKIANEQYKKPLYDLIDVLKNWKPDKIYFIFPQVIMSITETDSKMYNMAVFLLTNYVNELPHQNAYWLTSFLIMNIEELKGLKRDKNTIHDEELELIKKFYKKRSEFGKKIYDNLSKTNQDIFNNYKKFQLNLKIIHEKLKHSTSNNSLSKEVKMDVKNRIKEINNMIHLGAAFILPKIKYMTLPFNFNEEADLIPYEVYANQSLRIVTEINKKSYDNKWIRYNNDFGMVENSRNVYIKSMSENFTVLVSKDRPIKITFTTDDGKDHHFLLKGGINDSVKESKALEVLSIINNIFSYEGLDKNYNIELKQYNFVPITTYSVLIEWLEKVETLKSTIDEEFEKFGVEFSTESGCENNNTKPIVLEIYDKCGAEANLLFNHFLNKYQDPNQWYEAKQRYIVSTAVWSMVGYVIGLGDRHCQNIMLSDIGEVCHIDFGYMLGIHRRLPIPEVIDFRFTKNVRRALGLFEEQGYFLYIADLTLKALFKHYDSIETRLVSFVIDPLTKKADRECMSKFMRSMKNSSKLESSLSKKHIYDMCISNSLDIRLKNLYQGWQPWV